MNGGIKNILWLMAIGLGAGSTGMMPVTTTAQGMNLQAYMTTLSTGEHPESEMTYHGYLVDRVRREGEARAAALVWDIHEMIMDDLQEGGPELIKKLDTFKMQATAVRQDQDTYRKMVAGHIMEMLNKSNRLERMINDAIHQYNYDMAVYEEWALQRAMSYSEMPVQIHQNYDAEEFLRGLFAHEARGFSGEAQEQARLSACVNAGLLAVTLVTLPFSWKVAVAEAVLTVPGEAAISTYRDVDRALAVRWGNTSEQLADALCFGGTEFDGIYDGLLRILDVRIELLEATLGSHPDDAATVWLPMNTTHKLHNGVKR